MPTATISGLDPGDKIDLAFVNFDSGGSVTLEPGNVLHIVEGGNAYDLQLDPSQSFAGEGFQLSDDGNVGTFVTVTCFMPGTKIRTPTGEVAVETLERSDLVMTTDGRQMLVSWIGRQTVSTKFADPLRVLPIRITAGSLDDNVPTRDLLVSPDHALLLHGVLIHAGALINGISIVRETNVPQTFTYYHVELEDHSLILAENTPAETFIDNVKRLAFDNWQEHEALYPEGRAMAEMPYPRAKAYRQVPRGVREKLEERGRRLYGNEHSSAA